MESNKQTDIFIENAANKTVSIVNRQPSIIIYLFVNESSIRITWENQQIHEIYGDCSSRQRANDYRNSETYQ